MTKGWKSLLGMNLRSQRVARNWTQKDLANQAGCSRATIAAIELGYEKEPSASMLTNIARALETTSEALLSGKLENNGRELRDPTDLLKDLKDLFDAMPIRINIFAEDGSEIDHTYWTKSKIFNTSGEANILALIIQDHPVPPELSRGDVVFADLQVSPSDGDVVICEHKVAGHLAAARYREDPLRTLWIEGGVGHADPREWAIRGVVMEVNHPLKDYSEVKTRTQYDRYVDTFMEYEKQLLEHAANMVRQYTDEEKSREFEERLKRSFETYQDTMKKYAKPFKMTDK